MAGRIRARAEKLSTRLAQLEAEIPEDEDIEKQIREAEYAARVLINLVRYKERAITAAEAVEDMAAGGVPEGDARRYLSMPWHDVQKEVWGHGSQPAADERMEEHAPVQARAPANPPEPPTWQTKPVQVPGATRPHVFDIGLAQRILEGIAKE